jgi:hypothetical protein
MVEAPGVAFILLADCPQSVSMVTWDIEKVMHC